MPTPARIILAIDTAQQFAAAKPEYYVRIAARLLQPYPVDPQNAALFVEQAHNERGVVIDGGQFGLIPQARNLGSLALGDVGDDAMPQDVTVFQQVGARIDVQPLDLSFN